MTTKRLIAAMLAGLFLIPSCDRDDGAKAVKRAVEQQPALLKAVQAGQVAVVRTLLAEGVDPNTSDGGMTALIYAAAIPDTTIAEALLAAGADPDQANSQKTTPLMTAAIRGNLEMVKLLLKHGAEVNREGDGGGTALTGAAAVAGSAEILRVLLDGGADPNVRDKRQSTPLMLAAAGGHVEVIKVLLEAGVDLEASDYRGETAVFYAVRMNKPKGLNSLIAAGARLDLESKEGPLVSLAMSPGREACLNALRQAGIRIPPRNPAVHVGKPNPATQIN